MFAVDIFSREWAEREGTRERSVCAQHVVVWELKSKLGLFSRQISNKSFAHFPALATLNDTRRITKKYSKSLSGLHREFFRRFSDLKNWHRSTCHLKTLPAPYHKTLKHHRNCNKKWSIFSLTEVQFLKLSCFFYVTLTISCFQTAIGTDNAFLAWPVCEQTFRIATTNTTLRLWRTALKGRTTLLTHIIKSDFLRRVVNKCIYEMSYVTKLTPTCFVIC